ncbi:hypothetical protein L0P57_01890 [Anaeromassilibacillus senegalensis]|uniref:Uncharacterized protein n=1 Tax=Anaeromassilibacillus senegalensis TaxID=1673717 RepID=A0ABS9MFY2_9FIRM|nr:hypothetical protein [Anaeromassilibacillus senegalensis]MCG4609695.1 hypothetical protein [Anaeromassilibacillus senegalensis]
MAIAGCGCGGNVKTFTKIQSALYHAKSIIGCPECGGIGNGFRWASNTSIQESMKRQFWAGKANTKFCNHERIQLKIGVAPLPLRHSA